MNRIIIFLISGCLMFPAVSQQADQQVEKDSVQQARLQQMKEFRRQKQVYDKMYALNPRQAVDSANWAKIRSAQGIEKLKMYQSHSRLDTLKEINLTGAGLKEIPAFVYNAKNLEILILDQNHIKKLPKQLANLPKLKRIYWRGNQLDEVWWIRIAKIEGLEKLDISNNALTRLPIGVRKLEGLEELVVEENFFEEVPVKRLSKADFIKTFSMNRSHQLQLGKNKYNKLSFLKVFKANKCELTYLDSSFYRMTGLNELQLQENQLKELPIGISSLEGLTKLSFYKNELTSLPKGLFELDLKVIDLYYNELEVIPESIGNMKDLEILFLAYNRIYSLPSSIDQLQQLEELYLHHNRLSVLPQEISNLENLKVARVNDNYLEEFPVQFLGMKHLNDLDISNNQIKSIPRELKSLDKLSLFTYQDNPIDFNAAENAHLANMIYDMIEKGVICVPRVYKEEVREPAE